MEFDKNGNLAEDIPEGGGDGSASGKIYTAVLSADEAESSAEITVSREKNSVYKLSVSRHERDFYRYVSRHVRYAVPDLREE